MIQLLAIAAILATGGSRTSVEFTKDPLPKIKKNVEAEKAVLIDVRSKEEWDEGHFEGSIFLPVTSLRKHSFDKKRVAKTLPKKKTLYAFCVVGMRAKEAAKILGQHGYEVRPIKPGYEDLLEAGFKKDESPRQRDAQ
jgi:phage shock protein E